LKILAYKAPCDANGAPLGLPQYNMVENLEVKALYRLGSRNCS